VARLELLGQLLEVNLAQVNPALGAITSELLISVKLKVTPISIFQVARWGVGPLLTGGNKLLPELLFHIIP
jgi:hypothetical protein